MTKNKVYKEIQLKNVRLSYNSLFKTAVYKGEDTGKYTATFILDPVKNAIELKEIRAIIEDLLKENKIKSTQLTSICLADGNDTDKEEYANKFTLKASTSNRIQVLNKDAKTLISQEDNVIYSGCYVDTFVTLHFSEYGGKRICAYLNAVRFTNDGERFGNSGGNYIGKFDPVNDEIPFNDIF
jgi:hypothetical protein